MLRVIFIGATLLLVACGGDGEAPPTPTIEPTVAPSASPETHAVEGAISLGWRDASNSSLRAGSACAGKGGYDDIQEGGAVTVRDGSGTVIATGRLAEGIGIAASEVNDFLPDCVHAFVVEVPRVDFYSFEVTHRGEIAYSYQEMVDADWVVAFSLGD